jgi:CRISPR/Cas system CMR-associated protein Cmr5 small subunit
MNTWIKGKQVFKSHYKRVKFLNERVFVLVNTETGKVISFESWQQAKRQGYVKQPIK